MEVMMTDRPDSMEETTEGCPSNDDILANYSNIDADLQSLGPSGPAFFSDPEILFLSPPNSPISFTNPASIDEHASFGSTPTIEATWPFLKTIHL